MGLVCPKYLKLGHVIAVPNPKSVNQTKLKRKKTRGGTKSRTSIVSSEGDVSSQGDWLSSLQVALTAVEDAGKDYLTIPKQAWVSCEEEMPCPNGVQNTQEEKGE